MVQPLSGDLANLEKHRKHLEQDVVKFRESLLHWQTWEAEYEGLKEDILGLGENHNDVGLREVGTDFGGTLLNTKEIESLFKDDKGQHRSSDHIVGLLSRRIDYVHENTKAVRAFLKNAEDKIEALFVLSRPEDRTDGGLPLTEILEELDDEGNIICTCTEFPVDVAPLMLLASKTTNTRDAAPQVYQALLKAGVKGLPEDELLSGVSADASSKEIIADHSAQNGDVSSAQTISKQVKSDKSENLAQNTSRNSAPGKQPRVERKKSVSFAEGTKIEDATTSKQHTLPHRPAKQSLGSSKIRSNVSLKQMPFKPNGTVGKDGKMEGEENAVKATKSIKNPMDTMLSTNFSAKYPIAAKGEQKTPDTKPFPAVIPPDESTEDALLRRQMIQYNMEDIGSVVAEIDLDDEDSDPFSDDEDHDRYGSDTDNEEDEFGRTTRKVIDEEFRKEMLELEKKLNATSIQNLGPEARISEAVKSESETEITPNMINKKADETTNKKTNQGMQRKEIRQENISPTKEVRFADELDIQKAPPPNHYITNLASNKRQPSQLESELPTSKRAPPLINALNNSSEKAVSAQKKRNGEKAEDPKKLVKTQTNPLVKVSNEVKTKSSATKETYLTSSLPVSTHNQLRAPHAAVVIERPYSSTTATPPGPNDLDFDPAILHKKIATEYHRVRNRMMQRQGGFLASAEEEATQGKVALTEEEGGGTKVSRFKAAKLRGMVDPRS